MDNLDMQKFVDVLCDTDVVQLAEILTGGDKWLDMPSHRHRYFDREFKQFTTEFSVFWNGLDQERKERMLKYINERGDLHGIF